MPSGAKPKFGWETVSRNLMALTDDWITEAEAMRATGFSSTSLFNFASSDGRPAVATRRDDKGREYNRHWLYQWLAELYGVAARDIIFDDQQRLATVRSLLVRWWAEPQPALIDTLSPQDLRPPPTYEARMTYTVSADPDRTRGIHRDRTVQPMHVLTCPTCGADYEGHPGGSTECRRCRSRTALLKMYAERRDARDPPPPDQPPTP